MRRYLPRRTLFGQESTLSLSNFLQVQGLNDLTSVDGLQISVRMCRTSLLE